MLYLKKQHFMPKDFLQKGLNLLLRQQTNILSAAFIIMSTVFVSQVLGVLRDRLLVSIFGASNKLGIYNYSSLLPDTVFQLIIAAAFSSAFIPVFSEYLSRNKEKEAHTIASTLLGLGMILFLILSIVLAIFAPLALSVFNLGGQFTADQMQLMANLMRIVMIGQIFFIIGTFLTALLQSYNHFFIPGMAAACYNLGIIFGVLFFHSFADIYAAPLGVVLGSLTYVLVQIPLARKVGFSFTPAFDHIKSEGIKKISRLMWPRTLQVAVFQLGTVAVAVIIAFMADPGRMKLLFDYAKTLAFAPVSLFGTSIAQAAFPMLSREKDKPGQFKQTFISSFNQMLYVILPVSAIILVLRVPIVRLAFGAEGFDWEATLLTGRTLAFLSISIFAQALIQLVNRGFYALHNTKIPLIVGAITTAILIFITYVFVIVYHFGLESVALAFTVSSILQLGILFLILERKTGGLDKSSLLLTQIKFFFATLFMAFALYIPIKLLDQLVFDTTRTINLIILTGISSFAGLSLYLFLTWLFNVKEAHTYILLFKKIGNWRDILNKSEEVIDGTRTNP